MSGVAVIGALLTGSAPLKAIVPEAQMQGGDLPANVSLPAICAKTVSATPRKVLKRGAVRRVTERVQVTVLAANYQQLKDIVKLVRSVCDGRIGAFAGVTSVSVVLGPEGPDFRDDAGTIFEQSHDFMVSFNEAA